MRDACRHSIDFSSVLWHGCHYSFTPTQAAVVRLLWEAWEDDCPEVRQSTLLDLVGSDGRRLADIFRRHAAWGRLIVSGETKGSVRLADAPWWG